MLPPPSALWGPTSILHDASCYTPFVNYEVIADLLAPSYDPPWLIPDLLTRGSLVILAGEAGVGKSTFCYTLAMCLATGRPFLGFPTSFARILYCDDENSRPDFTGYWRQVWIGQGRPPAPVLNERLHFASFQLGLGWLSALQRGIEERKPDLLIIDTATPSLHIQDEDKNAEASLAIHGLRSLQTKQPLTILVLKHARIVEHESGQDRYILRGAKAWLGETDATWFLTFAPGKPPADPGTRMRVLTPRKTRAFGLKKTIKLSATYTTEGDDTGLIIKEKPE